MQTLQGSYLCVDFGCSRHDAGAGIELSRLLKCLATHHTITACALSVIDFTT